MASAIKKRGKASLGLTEDEWNNQTKSLPNIATNVKQRWH